MAIAERAVHLRGESKCLDEPKEDWKFE